MAAHPDTECSVLWRPPYDREIRPLLLRWLGEQHAEEADTVILEELGLNRRRVRADLVVINGALHGYEIKSEYDSLRRLRKQVELYDAVFDRATLVVSRRHLSVARNLLPSWWGIIVVEGFGSTVGFRTLRRGRRNRSRLARTLVEFIWRDDAMALLERKVAARGYRSSPRRLIWDRICELYSLEEIATEVRRRLKARAATSVA